MENLASVRRPPKITMKSDYMKSFERNIGVISEHEQQIVKNATVAIAGLGGIGGVTVSILARMGFTRFRIADIDRFEIQNLNRQAASSHSVLGKKKVDVIRKMIMDINPEAEITCFYEGVQPENVDRFLEKTDIVVDAIDFFCFNARNTLQLACEKLSIPVAFSAPLGMTATFILFGPGSMGYREYFDFRDEQDAFDKLIRFSVGIAPSALHRKHIDFDPKKLIELETGPSLAPAVHLGGAVIATEILKQLTKRGTSCMAPEYLQIDLFKGRMVKRKLLYGNRGPLQRMKIRVASYRYGKYKPRILSFIH